MKAPRPPRLEERRAPEFLAELEERAQAWIPEWGLADAEHDFGRALLNIAARLNSEVAERFDGAGEKMRRGFLDWLGVRGEAARPARMPVVFKLADTAREGVLASAPVRMQGDADGTPVVFETEKDVRIVPGRLEVVVGVDADQDAFYLPPPGLSDLNPLEPSPTQWQVKSFAAAGAGVFQLDPEAGLLPDTIIQAGDQQYRIVKADKDLVTIEPPLVEGLVGGSSVTKVTTFTPFEGRTRNRQEHALYLGDSELLNIEEAATFEVVGASALREGFVWQYWGKAEDDDEAKWRRLEPNLDRQKQINNAVALKKPKGAMELHEIQGKNARWIRAYQKTVSSSNDPFTNDQVSLVINSYGCREIPCPPAEATDETPALVSPEAEAMANNTPLVLSDFFPLGKEPRQFDAFYLGSKEAFSKTGAKVSLCFEMAEAKFSGLSSLHVPPRANTMLAGVAADGFLHLLQFDPATGLTRLTGREPVRPPSPDKLGATVEGPPIALDPEPGFRLPIWVEGQTVLFAVTAKNSVWIWREVTNDQPKSGWESAGSIGVAGKPITGLVHLADAPHGQLFGLQESKLYVRDLNDSSPTWELVKRNTGPEIPLAMIVPIGVRGGDIGAGVLAEGLIAVDTANKLYGVTFVGSNPIKAKYQQLLTGVGLDLSPAAVRRNDTDKKLVVVAIADAPAGQTRELLGFLSKPGPGSNRFDQDDTDNASLDSTGLVGHFLDVNQNNTELTFVTCTRIPGEPTYLAAWAPFNSTKPAVVFSTKIPSDLAKPDGSPTLLEKHVVVPTTSSQVLVAPFDVNARLHKQAELKTAVIASSSADLLQLNDQVFIPVDDNGVTKYQLEVFTGNEVVLHGQKLYEFAVESTHAPFFVYRANATVFAGTVDPLHLDELKIDPNDPPPQPGSQLLITTHRSIQLYTVGWFDPGTSIATLDRPLDITNAVLPITYRATSMPGSELRPLLRLNTAAGNTGDWNVAMLDRVRLAFPEGEPNLQHGLAFEIDSSTPPFSRPKLVVLGTHWLVAPLHVGATNEVKFIVDTSVGDWGLQLGDTLSNPELSWEYWNGKGWWTLGAIDSTGNLKTTANVTFDVPSDITSSDWAGKTNYWIRARLTGGDYGREKITVEIKNVPGGTEQTVKRSLEGIRAPKVRALHISYAVCKPALPIFVLAEDSGTMRDQSDANRTPGAIVEAFVPLALTLGRLSKNVAPTEKSGPSDDCLPDNGQPENPKVDKPKPEGCPPECDCKTLHASKAATPSSVVTTGAPATTRVTGRELYVGLAATPSKTPVNVLLLVDERPHAEFAPLQVEALGTDRFKPIVAGDATRALGESGVLSMSFPAPPTRAELFGKENLTWLRLKPGSNATDKWLPSLRGAYLNAAWASATETLTRELLGSSNGGPNLVVRLARPPVLRDTLELRVKEPLGEEERKALLKIDPNSVLSVVEGLPGDWVLWKQVPDPDDEAAAERVYALDERKGEIRFGDGQHGKIPPIGQDSIVAFRYCRTESDPRDEDKVPANNIAARTALNLVSPVKTVESVTAADQAAGGAPPESDDRVLRFGFARQRHRRRAVTAYDLEDLTLQSSPDIAQARAFVRRGYVRLVVVMRGKNPLPNAAQIRELRRLLLDAAPVFLSAPAALRIEQPKIRRLRISVKLRVESLDHTGELSAFVKEKFAGFFDTATGGVDKDGWALGLEPSENDIAFALSDAPYLDSIEDVSLIEIADDEKEHPWEEQPTRATEIVMLDEDPVRFHFETAEVMA